MSVIFGIKDPDNNPTRIIICGDKRASSIAGEFINDDMQKVTVINDKLAFASAGNAAIEKAVTIDSGKVSAETQTTDTLLKIIIDFYDRAKALNLTAITLMPFSALIAGENDNGTPSLVSVSCVKGKLSYAEVPMALYPPAGMSMQDCANIFVRNYKLNHNQFCQGTVREISRLSKVVSPTGTIWTYDFTTRKGVLQEF